MIFSAIFHLVPWYVWLLGIVALVLFTYLGLWPLVIGFLRRIPWQIWGIVGTAAMLIIWLNYHDAALAAKVTKERDDYWQARETKANKDYADNLVAIHRKLEIADGNARDASARHALELAARDKKHAADFAVLEKRRAENVTAKANADCNLTTGVILQFNEGAARANGSDAARAAAATGPGAGAVDAPSGITLDTYVAGVEGTQGALGACRNQVIGWQSYQANVIKPWIASTLEALSTCIPKGAP